MGYRSQEVLRYLKNRSERSSSVEDSGYRLSVVRSMSSIRSYQ